MHDAKTKLILGLAAAAGGVLFGAGTLAQLTTPGVASELHLRGYRL